MAGYWNTKSEFSFNLKLAVGYFLSKSNSYVISVSLLSQKGGVRYLSGMIKDPSFLSKLVVTVDPYALSFVHENPTAEKISSTIVPDPKKLDKFLNVSILN